MNFHDLLGVGDVVPVAIGFPAFGDNLNEDTSDGRLRNVGNALDVGLDVDFGFFVFDQAIFVSLEIDAGVFDRLILIAAGNFNGETRNGGLRGRLFGRSGLLRERNRAGSGDEQ